MSVTLYRRGVDSSISSDFQALDSLQRQYRTLEYARKDTKNDEGGNSVFRVQKHLIDKLKRDRDRLKTELSIETRQARLVQNPLEASQIVRLQDQGDLFSRLIENERRKIEDLEKQVEKLQRAIAAHRRETGGLNAARESNEATLKQIKILENRLDKALVKLNESLANNKNLRNSIENLRRERAVFDGIYKKLERELGEKKAKMGEILLHSQEAAAEKNAAEEDLLAMKRRAEAEQENFEWKWNEIGDLMEENRQIKAALRQKEAIRAVKLFGSSAPGVHQNHQLLGLSGDSMANFTLSPGSHWQNFLDNENRLRKKLQNQKAAIAREEDQIAQYKMRVFEYERNFQAIQEATGIFELDALVAHFLQAEEGNYSLFNEVNELAAQIAQHEENQQKNQVEIRKFQERAISMHFPDSQRSQMLEELNEQLKSTENASNSFLARYQQSLECISVLKDGIVGIYRQLDCETMPEHQKLVELFGNLEVRGEENENFQQNSPDVGNSPGSGKRLAARSSASFPRIPYYYGLTETNLLKYLGMIEVRANELLRAFVKAREAEATEEEGIQQENEEISGLEETIRALQQELSVEEDYGEFEDEEEDELRKAAVHVNLTDAAELRKKIAGGSKYYRRRSSIMGMQEKEKALINRRDSQADKKEAPAPVISEHSEETDDFVPESPVVISSPEPEVHEDEKLAEEQRM